VIEAANQLRSQSPIGCCGHGRHFDFEANHAVSSWDSPVTPDEQLAVPQRPLRQPSRLRCFHNSIALEKVG